MKTKKIAPVKLKTEGVMARNCPNMTDDVVDSGQNNFLVVNAAMFENKNMQRQQMVFKGQ